MPDLAQALQHRDFGFVRITAELWGIELLSQELDDAIDELARALKQPDLTSEVLSALNPQLRSALATLAAANGRIPWAPFARQFGEVRDMGEAKRDREKPYLKPASASEALYYRALLFRAFFNTEKGPQEYAYIPDDLLPLVQRWEHKEEKIPDSIKAGEFARPPEPPGRGATPGEKRLIIPASDRILDDATTLLAALRLGRDIQPEPKLLVLLQAAGLIAGPAHTASSKGNAKSRSGVDASAVNAEKVKIFLEAARTDALKMLRDAWRDSEAFNELRLMPGLVFEGEWQNQALVTREFLLDLLEGIPEGAWWSLNAFVSGIKKTYPDYERPAGDYDSWFIRREADGTYLRGFAYWEQVDGALVRFFVTDILHWLGMLDLAVADEGGPVTAFHRPETPPKPVEENGKITVASNGKIVAGRLAPRVVRYQLSRFCEWDEERPDEYRYHVTPRSLTKAKEQGLKVEHLLALLARHAEAGIPPVLLKALKRWEANGTEAKAATQVILKVSRPEVLEELRQSKAARFLGEPLGPTSVIIKAGAQAKVMAALAEMGLMAEDETNEA